MMDENLAVFVNRRKKLTTREELEKCSKEVGQSITISKLSHVQILWSSFIVYYIFEFIGAYQSSDSVRKSQSTTKECAEERN